MEKILAIIDNFDVENAKFHTRFTAILESILSHIQFYFVHYSQLSNPIIYQNILENEGLLLTGSYNDLSSPETIEKYAIEQQLIQDFKKPIFGVCFGHQLIATSFGFQVQPMIHPDPDIENEKILELPIHPPFELFPRENIMVYETHHEEIKPTSEYSQVFQNYATSPSCEIQMVKHRELPIYGMQFHPENPHPTTLEDGKLILANFIKTL